MRGCLFFLLWQTDENHCGHMAAVYLVSVLDIPIGSSRCGCVCSTGGWIGSSTTACAPQRRDTGCIPVCCHQITFFPTFLSYMLHSDNRRTHCSIDKDRCVQADDNAVHGCCQLHADPDHAGGASCLSNDGREHSITVVCSQHRSSRLNT